MTPTETTTPPTLEHAALWAAFCAANKGTPLEIEGRPVGLVATELRVEGLAMPLEAVTQASLAAMQADNAGGQIRQILKLCTIVAQHRGAAAERALYDAMERAVDEVEASCDCPTCTARKREVEALLERVASAASAAGGA